MDKDIEDNITYVIKWLVSYNNDTFATRNFTAF